MSDVNLSEGYQKKESSTAVFDHQLFRSGRVFPYKLFVDGDFRM